MNLRCVVFFVSAMLNEPSDGVDHARTSSCCYTFTSHPHNAWCLPTLLLQSHFRKVDWYLGHFTIPEERLFGSFHQSSYMRSVNAERFCCRPLHSSLFYMSPYYS